MKRLDQPDHRDDDVPLVQAVALVLAFVFFCLSLTMLAFY